MAIEYPFVRDGATVSEIAERMLSARRYPPVAFSWVDGSRKMKVMATINEDLRYDIEAWFIDDQRVNPFPVPDVISNRIAELGRE